MAFRFPRGHGRKRHVPGQMNKLESKFADWLFIQQHEGRVLWWKFEAVRLKLADATTYTPDFVAMLAGHNDGDGHWEGDGEIVFYEIKGFREDDAMVKIKVAAELFPFKFVLVENGDAGAWKQTVFVSWDG